MLQISLALVRAYIVSFQDSMVGIEEELKNKTNTVKSLEQRQKRNEDLAKKLEEQRKLEENKSTAEKVLFNIIPKLM